MADKSPRKQNKTKKVSIQERQARKKAKKAAVRAALKPATPPTSTRR